MNPISPPKKKFPRAAAIEVAREMVRALEPACERIVIAGSLRRRKEAVGDVEVLLIPRYQSVLVERTQDLFVPTCTILEDMTEEVLIQLIGRGILNKRQNSLGSEVWGKCNRLALHVASGIPVDLFSTTKACWWNYVTCRTGGAENNVRIAAAAKAKGYTWHPYGEGFSDQEGNLVPVESEQDVFRIVGLPYLEPWERA